MTTRNAEHTVASAFSPNWSADAIAAAAMARTMPPLHTFDFQPPANADSLHRPRRVGASYITQVAPAPFRVRG